MYALGISMDTTEREEHMCDQGFASDFARVLDGVVRRLDGLEAENTLLHSQLATTLEVVQSLQAQVSDMKNQISTCEELAKSIFEIEE